MNQDSLLRRSSNRLFLLWLLTLLLGLQLRPCHAQDGPGYPLGTAFSYQGRLTSGTNAASGSYDVRYSLYGTNFGGIRLAGPLTNAAVAVSNGLFTTYLDFGPGVFSGSNMWLEVAMRPSTNNASFATISPRQLLAPVPYALYAPNAGSADALLGLQIQQNGTSPNLIAGYSGNSVSSGIVGSVIGGGGASNQVNTITGNYGTIGGGLQNSISANPYATIAGGLQNVANGYASTIGGGDYNYANSSYSTVAGGLFNNLALGGNGATISGGQQNNIWPYSGWASVGGGFMNTVGTNYGTVPGGYSNLVTGLFGFAAGQQAQALHQGAFVWADSRNGPFGSTGNDQFLIRANGGVGIGTNNPAGMLHVVGGGSGPVGILMRGWPTGGQSLFSVFPDPTSFPGEGHLGYNPGAWLIPDGSVDQGGHCTSPFGFTIDKANGSCGGLIGFRDAGADTWVIGDDRTTNFILGRFSGPDTYANRIVMPFDNENIILGESGGSVGIGTTPIDSRLQVAAVSGNGVFASTSDSSAAAVFGLGATGVYGYTSTTGGKGVFGQAVAGTGNTCGGLFQYGSQLAYLGTPTLAGDFYGDVHVSGNATVCVLTITGGCDLSEPFKVSSSGVPKGSLVVIDEANPGQLKPSDRAYDTRVAGIVSGANGINPGLMLHQQGLSDGGENVALSGRVYALADAANGPIRPGDLLTTSDTPGHCMRVTDHRRAQGAVIGKAMSPLPTGRGMVLVLVSLQ